MMSPNEFKEKMQQISEKYKNDVEALHVKMDNLMCEVLKEHGYEEGIEIFKDSDLYYA